MNARGIPPDAQQVPNLDGGYPLLARWGYPQQPDGVPPIGQMGYPLVSQIGVAPHQLDGYSDVGQMGYPHLPDGGTPTCQLDGGMPLSAGWGYASNQMDGGNPLPPPSTGWGYSPSHRPDGGTPSPGVGRQTEACQIITSPRTSYVGGNNDQFCN